MLSTGNSCDGVPGCVAGSEYRGVALESVTADSDEMVCSMPGCTGGSCCMSVGRSGGVRGLSSVIGSDVLESPPAAPPCGLGVGTPVSARTASGLLTASIKLTRDERLLAVVPLLRRLCTSGDWTGGGTAAVSCSARRIVSSMSSSSDSVSSSSSSADGRPLVMRNTPKKVRKQPPMNFRACSAVVRSKSRYRTALPIITHRVNETNWIGMTCVESNRCSALLT